MQALSGMEAVSQKFRHRLPSSSGLTISGRPGSPWQKSEATSGNPSKRRRLSQRNAMLVRCLDTRVRTHASDRVYSATGGCADTRALFEIGKCKRFSRISKVATRKLANWMRRTPRTSCAPRGVTGLKACTAVRIIQDTFRPPRAGARAPRFRRDRSRRARGAGAEGPSAGRARPGWWRVAGFRKHRAIPCRTGDALRR